jgi:hypothetical protein
MKNLLVSCAVSLFLFAVISSGANNAYGQEKTGPRVCTDVPGQTSDTHRFRLGETIEIPLRGENVPASVADCDPVELKVYWSNGRNNGSMFNITILDDRNTPIHSRQIAAFFPGVVEFPLSSFDTRPAIGSALAMVSVPTKVTIEAVYPYAPPATLSYRVTRVARERAAGAGGTSGRIEEVGGHGNEIVSIHNATRLIGSSRVPLVQIELATSRPFPVKDVPLQLQIGTKVFVDELTGSFTGRKLTLSLTPEMFAELKDGDEVSAFFGKSDGKELAEGNVWNFGKLEKGRRREQ